MIDFLVIYDYVAEVFHVDKVCEWPLLQQMKVCLNVLKICYDVSMNKTNSFWSHTTFLSPFDKKSLFYNLYLSN